MTGIGTRLLTLISGVLAIVLPQIAAFHLSAPVDTGITIVGGALLVTLATLEHPTTKSIVNQPAAPSAAPINPTPPPSSIPKGP